MKVVLKEWLKNKKACAMLIIFALLQVLGNVIGVYLIRIVSDAIADVYNLQNYLWKIVFVSMFGAVCSIAAGYLRIMAQSTQYSSSMDRFADKVLDSDVEMFTKYSSSYIITMSNNINNITKIAMEMVRCINNLSNIVVTILMIYLVGGKVVIPIIAVYLVGALLMKWVYRVYDKIDAKNVELQNIRNQEVENVINGFQEVRTFDTINHHKNSIHGLNHRIHNGKRDRANINAVGWGTISAIDTIGLLAMVMYVGYNLVNGNMAQSVAMSLVMYELRILNPMLSVIDFLDELSNSLSVMKMFDEFMNYESISNDGKLELSEFNHGISINDLHFSYDSTNTVVNGVNMEIKKGSKVGICGRSGSAKSTIFKLINKFYVADRGNITIDGFDIDDLSNNSYRKFIGSVHQDNTIFPGTIMENIKYGNFNALEIDVVEACKKANIYDFIMSQPNKFDTLVGPRGLNLSGGQKQRIALARLMLSDPEIILLDEATSALDNESEYIVQDAIEKFSDKTIVTIAHRLSTIKNSDVIYVIDGGKVIEKGNHNELMKLKGVYYEMSTIQEKERR